MVWPPYQAVLRLIAVAEDNWAEVDAAYPTVDFFRLPLHRFLNFVYAWLVKNATQEQREQIDLELNAPIVTGGKVQPASPMSEEQEGQLFMDLMKRTQGA